MRKLDARLERGFDLLDGDHHALDGLIEGFTQTANGVMQKVQDGADWRAPADTFRSGLKRFETDLNRHLIDEEDLIVPILLKYAPNDMT